jgi:transcriptional regulator of NAD metabolism
MNPEQRRKELLDMLSASTPVCASYLAKQLKVSRQIIVGDISILRAKGETIIATPRGYILQYADKGIKYQIACLHNSENMRAELNAIVDQNCKVIDVIVEHPVYGQLCGMLQLSTRMDVEIFINKCSKAQPLSFLTDGIHIHTLSCPNEEAFERVKLELTKLKILLSNS